MTDFFFQMKKELVKEEVETRENSETPDSRRIKVTNTSPLDNVSVILIAH